MASKLSEALGKATCNPIRALMPPCHTDLYLYSEWRKWRQQP